MTKREFIQLLKTFVDPGDSIDTDVSQIVFSIAGVSYLLSLKLEHGELFVCNPAENVYISANTWIINNLAHLDLLAQRLVDMLEEPANFISPSIIKNIGETVTKSTGQALEDLREYVDSRAGSLQTNVLYLVSNAGEGKSTVLKKFAIEQARKYKNRETGWLLVPIELGGRTFMRFDDITIGVLQNKYRFQYLYYNSFIELVKLGLIVPAFDGFEEMFVETSSKEAFTAMSTLVKSMESVGTMIVAARKAFFDFENNRNIENIIRPIQDEAIVFDKFEIEKWTREQFIQFAFLNKVPSPEELYTKVLGALSQNTTHPILTRPVFVKKLFELCKNDEGQEDFVARIRSANTQIIRTFIESIIQRESMEKWIERSGNDEVQTPILSVEEHVQLLALVAMTMWETQKESIDTRSLEFVANYFSELTKKPSSQATKIVARLPSHALIVGRGVNTERTLQYAFEHESFWMYFLGYAIYQQIEEYCRNTETYLNLRNTLRSRIIPIGVIHSVVDFLMEMTDDEKRNVIVQLIQFASLDDKASYTQDNSSSLIIRLLKDLDYNSNIIRNLNFTVNSLQSRILKNVGFETCFFSSTAVKNSKFINCFFRNCIFESLNFTIADNESKANFIDTKFYNCDIHSLQLNEDTIIWDPGKINSYLTELGLSDSESIEGAEEIQIEIDDKLACFTRVLRYFQRSTHISDSVIQMKTGSQCSIFIEEILPELLQKGIFVHIPNKGSSNQNRYKLGIPINIISESIKKAKGSFDSFLGCFY